jgi:hypothetical protein
MKTNETTAEATPTAPVEAQYSPLPWRINAHHICAGGYVVAGVEGTTGYAAGNARANAALIVEAVNNHARLTEENKRLREALEACLEELSDLAENGVKHGGEKVTVYLDLATLTQARAALAKT